MRFWCGLCSIMRRQSACKRYAERDWDDNDGKNELGHGQHAARTNAIDLPWRATEQKAANNSSSSSSTYIIGTEKFQSPKLNGTEICWMCIDENNNNNCDVDREQKKRRGMNGSRRAMWPGFMRFLRARNGTEVCIYTKARAQFQQKPIAEKVNVHSSHKHKNTPLEASDSSVWLSRHFTFHPIFGIRFCRQFTTFVLSALPPRPPIRLMRLRFLLFSLRVR